jgi:fumarate hydratase class II
MPGKVNPVLPEAVLQVAVQVVGNDVCITLGGQWGAFELNTMLPVMSYNLLQSIEILGNAVHRFAAQCIAGISANREQCRLGLERSLALSTYLVPALGYDKAAALAREAYRSGKTIREAAEESRLLSKEDLGRLLEGKL